ncbi:SRPBCC family protein [Capillimicrobium parvum]|uniref:Polyketide cyclase n=1 Tax=Capillimicrobium parvum TaxID=2884022 RepID=A0A9E7C1N8_9ACTN|nr:SRPBCC family protein [Capillimicrobium parvum]UGS36792.1 hypothetical protein DSM104329_03203 [Capillimicrobium parvum]
MAGRYQATVTIDRPIEAVFDWLAAGVNDRTFSPRVQEIAQATDGPVGPGTVFRSTVKDAGMTTKREFAYTAFERPVRLRWTERSKNLVTVPDGGYDLVRAGDGATRLTVFNTFEGHGLGKLFAPLALRAARRTADDFAGAIKRAVEEHVPADAAPPGSAS